MEYLRFPGVTRFPKDVRPLEEARGKRVTDILKRVALRVGPLESNRSLFPKEAPEVKLIPFLREDVRPPEGREEVQKAPEVQLVTSASYGKLHLWRLSVIS
jgi:hypothetical protein